jgi:hypothetical protein
MVVFLPCSGPLLSPTWREVRCVASTAGVVVAMAAVICPYCRVPLGGLLEECDEPDCMTRYLDEDAVAAYLDELANDADEHWEDPRHVE